jgi:hypothetical protein
MLQYVMRAARRVAAGAVPFALPAVLPATLPAQTPPASPAGDSIPVRKVTAAEARAKEGVQAVTMLRALSDGSVFVNDAQGRRIVRYAPGLDQVTVIADTMPNARIPYPQRPLGMLPYAGDSTILVDPSTLSFVLLDPQGRQVRVMAPPRTGDINTLATTNLGSNAFDPQGRLIYRAQGGPGGGGPFGGGGMMMFGMGGGGRGDGGRGGQGGQGGGDRGGQQQRREGQPAGQGGPPGGFGGGFGGGPGGPGGRGFNPANQPDSVPIVRADFDTRTADTLAWVKVPRTEFSMSQTPEGGMRLTAKLNPMPQGDDWALLADGTVAVIRVLDYHVDYYAPDGTHTAGPRLPFDWKRITDDDRVKLIDSMRTVAKAAAERAQAMGAGGGRGFSATFEPIEPEKLPDYYPPIRPGTSMADRDGNLWVLPSTSTLAGQLAAQFAQMAGRGGPPGGMGGMFGGGGPPGGGARPGAAGAQGDSARRAGGGPPGGGMAAMAGLMGPMAGALFGPFVYDVVNRQGQLAERVQLPPGRQLAGFGPNGAIYLTAREGRELVLERVRREAP